MPPVRYPGLYDPAQQGPLNQPTGGVPKPFDPAQQGPPNQPTGGTPKPFDPASQGPPDQPTGGTPKPFDPANQGPPNQPGMSQDAPIPMAGPIGAPNTQPIAQSFQDALVQRLNPTVPNVNNPAILPAIQANQYFEQRGLENARQMVAEQNARDGANGAASGANDAALLGLAQDSAARQGQFAGDAVQHLSDLQNQNANNALGTAGGYLTADQGRQLQQRLAEMSNNTQRYGIDTDSALRRLGITQQGSLGTQDLALRRHLGDVQGHLGLLSLLQGGDQFNRQLAQQGQQFSAGLDNSSLLSLLGML